MKSRTHSHSVYYVRGDETSNGYPITFAYIFIRFAPLDTCSTSTVAAAVIATLGAHIYIPRSLPAYTGSLG